MKAINLVLVMTLVITGCVKKEAGVLILPSGRSFYDPDVGDIHKSDSLSFAGYEGLYFRECNGEDLCYKVIPISKRLDKLSRVESLDANSWIEKNKKENINSLKLTFYSPLSGNQIKDFITESYSFLGNIQFEFTRVEKDYGIVVDHVQVTISHDDISSVKFISYDQGVNNALVQSISIAKVNELEFSELHLEK